MNINEFKTVSSSEPHAIRRRALLLKYPQARQLIGHDRLTQVIILFIVIAQYSMAYFIQNIEFLQSIPVFLLVSFVIGGTLNHWAGMGIHECSHNLAAPTPSENKLTAILANLPLLVPSAMPFFRYHLAHHSHLGIERVDNDLPSRMEVRLIKNNSVLKFLWMSTYIFFGVFGRGFFNRPNRWETFNILISIINVTLIFTLIGPWALGYLLVSTLFGYSLLHPAAAHFLHEHYLWKEDQETYSYYGILNLVNFNVGYHVEHHDIVNIPGRRLPKLKKMAPEFYDHLNSSKSWAYVLYDFATNPNYGHFSRMIREKVKGQDSKLTVTINS